MTPAQRQAAYRQRQKEKQQTAQAVSELVPAAPDIESYDLTTTPGKIEAAFEIIKKDIRIAELEEQLVFKDDPVKRKVVRKKVDHEAVIGEPIFPTDRDEGLPRSNYDSDHAAPGGWAETIRRMHPHLVTKILDKVAPPRRMR